MLDNLRKDFSYLEVGFFALMLFLMTMFSLRFDPDLKDLDDGVYSNYLTSLVTDRDLNIINQLPEEKRWMVTSSYNHPTLHDHGVSIFWLPSYLYLKILKELEIEISYDNQKNYRSAMVLSNSFYFLLLVVLAGKIFPLIWDRKPAKLEVIAMIFGTPLFWYGFIQPSSADVTSSVIPFFLLLVHIFLLRESKNKPMYFFYGSLIAIGIILKITLLFYSLLPIHLAWEQYKENKFEVKNFLFLSLGFLLPAVLFFVNEYLKYGSLSYSYTGIVGPFNVLMEILIGPAGYITVSPLYIVLFFSLFFLSKDFKYRGLLFFLLLIPVFKLFAESYSFQGNADFGGRHLIADSAVLILLIPCLFRNSEIIKKLICFYCICHTVLMASSFYYGIGGQNYIWGALYLNPINSLIEMFPNYKYFVMRFLEGFFDSSIIELFKLLPLFLFFSFLINIVIKLDLTKTKNVTRLSSALALSCITIYLSVTLLNVFNNKPNSEELREQGFYDSLVVVNGVEAFYFYDNVSNLLMHKKFLTMRGKVEEAENAEEILKEYYKKVRNQILVDPIGLKRDLERGHVNFPDPFFGTNKTL